MAVSLVHVSLEIVKPKNVRKGGHSVRRASEILGTPVLNLMTDAGVGEAEDVIFSPDGQLLGLILSRRNWLERTPFLPRENIKVLGKDVIFSTAQPLVWCKKKRPKHIAYIRGPLRLKGQQVLTQQGKQLGILENVYLDEQQGRIVGYEISAGFVSDLFEGRTFLSHSTPIKITRVAVILPLQ